MESCSICLEELNNNSVSVDCPGKHKFHKSCIKRWRDREHITCPVCRGNIGGDERRNTNFPSPPPTGWAGRHGYTNQPPENRPKMRRGSPPIRSRRQRANLTPSPVQSPIRRRTRINSSPVRRRTSSPSSSSPKGCIGRFCKYLGIRAGSKKKNLKKKNKSKKK
jgi:hypothetical protein